MIVARELRQRVLIRVYRYFARGNTNLIVAELVSRNRFSKIQIQNEIDVYRF